MDYQNINTVMEYLGPAATREDAEAAMERAQEWYNSSNLSKADILAWYETARAANGDQAPSLYVDEGGSELVDGWDHIVMFYRAVSLADL